MRKRRRALSPEQQHLHGQHFLDNVLVTGHYRRARALACYMPVNGELDTRPLMHHSLETGRDVYLPVIDGGDMWFAQWHGESLSVNRTARLPQPAKRSQRLQNTRALDMVIVPLVAFTEDGTRLGQGGGYYDRMFAHHRYTRWRRPALIGAAHHIQQTETIPRDPWDVSLSAIITNRNIIMPNQKRKPQ